MATNYTPVSHGNKFRNATLGLALLAALCSAQTLSAHDFEVDGIYYNYGPTEGTAIVTSSPYNGYSGAVLIPEAVTYAGTTYRVTEIDAGAFFSCSSMTEVFIPSSITTMGSSAFQGCIGLTAIRISDIASWLNIQFVNIYSNPLYFAQHLYIGDSEVTVLNIPDGVTTIGNFAFRGCIGLTEVTIPNSVTIIGIDAFEGCSSLTEVNIPNSVTTIEEAAFNRCSSMTKVTIPSSVTTLGPWAFGSCSTLTEVSVPGNIASVEDYTFWACRNLKTVILPNTVTSIGEMAFGSCENLTEAPIPNSVTTIGNSAFSGCIGLTSVTIPSSVTSVGDWAFYYCSSLTSITSLSTTPPAIEANTFDTETEQMASLHVPAGAKTSYEQAPYWSNFFNIAGDAETGIDAVYATDATAVRPVFNLGGQRIEADSPEGLPSGTYIVGGKKVMKQ